MSLPWPRPGDRLFKSGGYQALMAHILPVHREEVGIVAPGYKDAGDILIKSLAENGRNDALTLPIIFCYRQYIELRLKDIIGLVNTFEESGQSFKCIHDLKKLWLTLRSSIEEEIDEQDREAFDAVEECIMELHGVDNKGTKFRYPVSIADMKFHQVDLGNLKSVMDRVSAFLDALADQWEDGVRNKF